MTGHYRLVLMCIEEIPSILPDVKLHRQLLLPLVYRSKAQEYARVPASIFISTGVKEPLCDYFAARLLR